MTVLKRWAFAPLLLLVTAIIGGSVATRFGHSELIGNALGALAGIALAVAVAYRRKLRGWGARSTAP